MQSIGKFADKVLTMEILSRPLDMMTHFEHSPAFSGLPNGRLKPARAESSQRVSAHDDCDASDACLETTIGGATMKSPTAFEGNEASGAVNYTVSGRRGVASEGTAPIKSQPKRPDQLRKEEKVSTYSACSKSVPC